MLPTVHYNMGGIPTNYHGEVISGANGNENSTVPGLMAIGEAVACRHGANRLGTNSLLDIVVFDALLHIALPRHVPREAQRVAPQAATDKALERFDRMRHASGEAGAAGIRLEMQQAMQRHAAVFRSSESLSDGVATMDKVAAQRVTLGSKTNH